MFLIRIGEIEKADIITTATIVTIITEITMIIITMTTDSAMPMIQEIRHMRLLPWLLPVAIIAAEQRSLEPVSAVTAVIN
jgi:hypothetical protein